MELRLSCAAFQNVAYSPVMPAALTGSPAVSVRSGYIIALLGINLWLAILVLPALFLSPTRWVFPLALIPLALLIWGIRRRSDALLFVAFSVSLLVPMIADPILYSPSAYGPLRLGLTSLSTLAYFAGCAILLGTTPSYKSTPLPKKNPLSRRNFLLALTVVFFIFPLVLLYFVNYSAPLTRFFESMYAGRVSSIRAIYSLFVLLLWSAILVLIVVPIFEDYRTGNRTIRRHLRSLQGRARNFRVRFFFFLFFALLGTIFHFYKQGFL